MKSKLLKLCILLISFVEGFILMANELLSAKLVSISFGISIYSWITLLSVTLFALGFGYYIGGIYAKKRNRFAILILHLLFIFVYQYVFTSHTLAAHFIDFEYYFGSILYFVIAIGPIVFGLGIVTPILIKEFKDLSQSNSLGFTAGFIYSVSTCGGVISTFIFGLKLIPINGLIFSKEIILYSYLLLFIPLMVLIFARKTKQATIKPFS